ncbi:MAG: amino acid adenylation domain-containing protein [Planctomycetales bacterium]|nr:amino acid adenylation domain-containing protein [Planctomycetales bacterium]
MASLLHDNLLHSAQRWPDHIAFRCGKDSLTYAQLDDASSRLANLLHQRGVRKGDNVAVRFPPCVQSPIAVYAAMKAGAAMVPIDPHTPTSRVCDILSAGNIRHMISSPLAEAMIDQIDRSGTPLAHVIGTQHETPDSLTFTPWSEIDRIAPLQLANTGSVSNHDDHPAYVIFTSGSTGTPKGIVHSHRSANSYVRLSIQTYGVGHHDRIANLSPLHFDMSTFGYYSSVAAGSTTVLVPPTYSMLPASLSLLIESERITIWYSVPFALIQLLERGALEKRDVTSLRWVMYGGEPLPPHHVTELQKHMPQTWISNVYGPAEVNQCTYYHLPPNTRQNVSVSPVGSIPIGRAWDETEIRIVDDQDRAVIGNDSGELLVHSPTMMTRYWHSSEDDLDVFYFDPESGNRFYRSGDLVRRRDDGELEFIGRMDRQVKLRGYRVELDEVEQVLAMHADVTEAAAFCADHHETKLLVAAVMTRQNTDHFVVDLRSHLSRKLPSYAIPGNIFVCQDFPRTTSGKIDRIELARRYATPAADPKTS